MEIYTLQEIAEINDRLNEGNDRRTIAQAAYMKCQKVYDACKGRARVKHWGPLKKPHREFVKATADLMT